MTPLQNILHSHRTLPGNNSPHLLAILQKKTGLHVGQQLLKLWALIGSAGDGFIGIIWDKEYPCH